MNFEAESVTLLTACRKAEIEKFSIYEIIKPYIGNGRCIRAKTWKDLPNIISIEDICAFLKKLRVNDKIDGRTHNGRMYVFIDFLLQIYGITFDENGFPLFNENLKYEDLSEEAWFIWRWKKLYRELYQKYNINIGTIEIQKKIEINIQAQFNYKLDLFFTDLNIGGEINESHHEKNKSIVQNDAGKFDLMKSCGIYLHNFYTSTIGISKKMNFEEKHMILRNNAVIRENLDELRDLILTRSIFLNENFRRCHTTALIHQKIEEKAELFSKKFNEASIKAKDEISKNSRTSEGVETLSNLVDLLKIYGENRNKYKAFISESEKNKSIIKVLYNFRDRGPITDKTVSFAELTYLLKLHHDKKEVDRLRFYISDLLEINLINENQYILNWIELMGIIQNRKFINSELKLYLKEYSQHVENIFDQYLEDIKKITLVYSPTVETFNNCIDVYLGKFLNSSTQKHKRRLEKQIKNLSESKAIIKELEKKIKSLHITIEDLTEENIHLKKFDNKPPSFIVEEDEVYVELLKQVENIIEQAENDSLGDLSAESFSDEDSNED